MRVTASDLPALVGEANLAPSVHNTQPTRWRWDGDGVLVLEDRDRRLPAGDPEGRDADVSHGAAIEGFALACSVRGVSLQVEPLAGEHGALREVARLRLIAGADTDPLQALASVRRTYRGAFRTQGRPESIDHLAAAGDVHLVSDPQAIAWLAASNDDASLRAYRDRAYRTELLSWMRLSRRHPQWSLDGLNAEAMEMSAFEAAGAGVVLKPGVFEALDRLGLARPLVAEAAVVRSARAVALFHRPAGETPLATGRRFHRLWLEFTAAGLSAAPMAVLADDAAARTAICAAFDISSDRRLITAFRLGVHASAPQGPKPRLPTALLVV